MTANRHANTWKRPVLLTCAALLVIVAIIAGRFWFEFRTFEREAEQIRIASAKRIAERRNIVPELTREHWEEVDDIDTWDPAHVRAHWEQLHLRDVLRMTQAYLPNGEFEEGSLTWDMAESGFTPAPEGRELSQIEQKLDPDAHTYEELEQNLCDFLVNNEQLSAMRPAILAGKLDVYEGERPEVVRVAFPLFSSKWPTGARIADQYLGRAVCRARIDDCEQATLDWLAATAVFGTHVVALQRASADNQFQFETYLLEVLWTVWDHCPGDAYMRDTIQAYWRDYTEPGDLPLIIEEEVLFDEWFASPYYDRPRILDLISHNPSGIRPIFEALQPYLNLPPAEWPTRDELAQQLPEEPGYELEAIMTWWERAAAEHWRTFFIPDAIELAAAIYAYRDDHNQWPEELKALVPKYMESLPTDPLTGDAVQYAVDEDGFELAIGPPVEDERFVVWRVQIVE